MNAPARPKPLPWDELKSRLDENQPFNMMPQYAVLPRRGVRAVLKRRICPPLQRRIRAKMRADRLDCVIVPGGPSHWSFGGGMLWLNAPLGSGMRCAAMCWCRSRASRR